MAGSSIVNYTGNAGLGLGSNPGMSTVNPNDNLKIIQDTGRDIMLLDAERNMKLFQQKIADRNKLTELILQNQVSTKNISPEYLPQFMKLRDASIKKFSDWGGNFNNIEGYSTYQGGITELQDYAAHAQTNTVQLQKLRQEQADQTLPWKKEELGKWIDQEQKKTTKNPWEMVQPHQQLFDFSLQPILDTLQTKTSTVMSPDGLQQRDVVSADYAGTLKKAMVDLLANNKEAEDQRQWLNKYDNYDDLQKKSAVKSLNSQLDKYNNELGLKEGDDGYADQIILQQGPNGTAHIKESPASFAAKYAIANQSQFKTPGPIKFQKDFGSYKLGAEKNQIAWAKLNKVDIPKAAAYVDKWNTQKGQLTDQEKVGAQKYNDLVDKIDVGGPGGPEGDGRIGTLNRINTDNLPASRQFIGGITYNSKGQKMLGRVYPKMNFYDPKKRGFTDDKDITFDKYESEVKLKQTTLPYVEWTKEKAKGKGYTVESYYDVKYYNPSGTEIKNESDLSPQLKKEYSNFVRDYGASFSKFLKGLGKLGKAVVEFHGDNGGVATPQTILEGTRMEQAQFGKKGFEGIYGGDETGDGTGADDNTPGM